MSSPLPEGEAKKGRKMNAVTLLEHGDGLTHMLVAGLLLLLAIGILIASTANFVVAVTHMQVPEFRIAANGQEHEKTFSEIGLAYLSELLFGVIVLELLSTILTYIRARNLEATIKDFLIVGLISSVRKILLIGAESSIVKDKGNSAEFIQESVGTVITIVGILLLIGGLLLLDRRNKAVRASIEA